MVWRVLICMVLLNYSIDIGVVLPQLCSKGLKKMTHSRPQDSRPQPSETDSATPKVREKGGSRPTPFQDMYAFQTRYLRFQVL